MHKGLMLLAVAIAGTCLAEDARDFRDLLGNNRSKADAKMKDRGFTQSREETRGGSRFAYWSRRDDCMEVEIRDGRYNHVTRVALNNCRNVVVDKGRGRGDGRPAVSYPSLRVDTDGRGSFTSSRYPSGKVTRGFVDTKSEPNVGFRVDGRVVTFYGSVVRAYSDREFEIQITRSSEGDARGTARFRLNGDRNEVEMISVDGNFGRERFNGSFNR